MAPTLLLAVVHAVTADGSQDTLHTLQAVDAVFEPAEFTVTYAQLAPIDPFVHETDWVQWEECCILAVGSSLYASHSKPRFDLSLVGDGERVRGTFRPFPRDDQGRRLVSQWGYIAHRLADDPFRSVHVPYWLTLDEDNQVLASRPLSPMFDTHPPTLGTRAQLRRTIRCFGRGFSRELTTVESESTDELGLVQLTGAGTYFGGSGTWNLTLDPSLGFLCRAASFQHRDGKILYRVTTSGHTESPLGPLAQKATEHCYSHRFAELIQQSSFTLIAYEPGVDRERVENILQTTDLPPAGPYTHLFQESGEFRVEQRDRE